MNESTHTAEDSSFVQRAMEAAIRIGVVALLVIWSLQIFRPFMEIVLWGIILAVALYPAFRFFCEKLGGRKKLTATLMTLVFLTLIIVPSVMFFGSAIDGARNFGNKLESGELKVPPLPDGVSGWPVVGEQISKTWTQAQNDLDAVVDRFEPQLKDLGIRMLKGVAGLGLVILQFIFALILAAVFLVNSEGGAKSTRKIACRFVGKRGDDFADMAEKTIRSVAVGVVGIAFIQAFLGGVAMALVGIPIAMLLALAILILAIVQLPPILILGPVAIYVFSSESTGTAVIFLIWALIVSASDGILKPLLLGRGVDVPMLVILIGAIGGMLLSGIIGLFIGAVVFALSYQLFMAWLNVPGGEAERGDAEAASAAQ